MTRGVDVESHTKEVEALKATEREQRYDYACLNSMSNQLVMANELFAEVRDKEVAEIWETTGDLNHYAGMDFNGARDHGLGYDQTAIWRIIRQMPKGALLHCHFDGTVDVRFLLAAACETASMAMKSSEPLCQESALFTATIEFRVLPDGETRSQSSIYAQHYTAGSWVDFATARNTFPYAHPYLTSEPSSATPWPKHMLPSATAKSEPAACLAFDAWLHSLMTLTPHAGVPAITNSKQAWAKFQTTFGVIAGLLGYEPTLKAYTKELLRSHARDGIMYTETRINFLEEYMVRANGMFDLRHDEWVQIFIEAVQEVHEELGVDAKIIYTTVRFIDNDKLRWYLEDCISLKKQFPDWIVGFDLVGHEDPLQPLKYYIPELLRFQSRCSEEGVSIPFVFHAGETLEDGGDADLNLYDALVLGTKRLGHGVSLARHPTLTEIVKERDICVEICPISNQVLGYTSSIAAHPSLLALLNRNVPVALSSDDPAIFENFGLSYDFYQLAISSKSTTLASLGQLARQSLRYVLLDSQSKERMLAQFEQEWKAFLTWFCKEFRSAS